MTEPAMPVFGRLVTAMVTPMASDGSLDLDRARTLAAELVDEQHNDALVISGTTGESPTTTDAEKRELLEVVVETVGDRAKVIAGIGTFDTAHSLHLLADAQSAGADGVLLVTPYYSRPTRKGLLAHFTEVADAAEVPIMLYDIPHRSGVPIPQDLLVELAAHERIAAVKDAKGDLTSSGQVMAQTDLAYYAGDDALTLPLLALGAVGVVGTSTHFSGARTKQLIEAFLAGDTAEALRLYRELLPVHTGVFAAPGVSMVKATLTALGRSAGPLRLPMVDPEPEQVDAFVSLLASAGL